MELRSIGSSPRELIRGAGSAVLVRAVFLLAAFSVAHVAPWNTGLLFWDSSVEMASQVRLTFNNTVTPP